MPVVMTWHVARGLCMRRLTVETLDDEAPAIPGMQPGAGPGWVAIDRQSP